MTELEMDDLKSNDWERDMQVAAMNGGERNVVFACGECGAKVKGPASCPTRGVSLFTDGVWCAGRGAAAAVRQAGVDRVPERAV
jgi:hypothetical protein